MRGMFQHNRRLMGLMEATNFVIRGLQLQVTDVLRDSAINRTARLFLHNQTISSIHMDLELDHTRPAAERFVAKGHILVGRQNLAASAHSENIYKAVDLLVEAFDALLRSRVDRRQEPADMSGLEQAVPNP